MIMIVRVAVAIVMAILLGNGSVVWVNHMPASWFAPEKILEADNTGRQRITSSPWKYIFVSLFVVSGVYLSVTGSMKYEIAVLIILFVVLEMAICDQLYRIVPDQLQLLLALSTIGLIGYNEKWWEPLAGAGIGLALGLAELGIGMLIYKKIAIGGADIKYFACMGLVAGRRGIIAVFVLTTFIFAIESVYLVARKRIKRKDGLALMPAAFVATAIYFLFLYNILDMDISF